MSGGYEAEDRASGYAVVECADLGDLEQTIDAWMRAGWGLVGGVSTFWQYDTRKGAHGRRYIQALWKDPDIRMEGGK